MPVLDIEPNREPTATLCDRGGGIGKAALPRMGAVPFVGRTGEYYGTPISRLIMFPNYAADCEPVGDGGQRLKDKQRCWRCSHATSYFRRFRICGAVCGQESELPERSSVRLGLKICAAMVSAAGWVVRTTPKEGICRSEQVQAIGSTAEWTSRRRPCRDDEEHIDQVVVDNLAWEERGFPVGVERGGGVCAQRSHGFDDSV